MKIKSLHSWKVTPKKAVQIQRGLRNRLLFLPLKKTPSLIAGTDISYSKNSDQHFAAVVVLSYPDLKIVDRASSTGRVSFPYVPGLLSFREVPLLLKAFRKLKKTPDLIFCDGQGLAHPRHMGLACHLGLVLNLPTLGVAKSPLYGTYQVPGTKKGERAAIKDGRERIGTILRTRDRVAPVFVSVGNRITLSQATRWVLKCSVKYRIPEPTRQAHILANEVRKLKAQS